MLDWSSHLPRVVALVVSAAVAAAAHGVYTSQSNTSATEAGGLITGLPSQSPGAGTGLQSDGRRRESARGRPDRRAVGGAGEFPGPTAGGSALPLAVSAPTGVPPLPGVDREVSRPSGPDVAPPESSPNSGDDGSLDRELQQLIDTGLPVAPDEQPTNPPDPGIPGLDVPAPDENPQPAPSPPPSGTPPATPATPAPPASPADPDEPAEPAQPVDPDDGVDPGDGVNPGDGVDPADPDTGLDDTPVGGLDGADPATPAEPADPDAALDDTAAGSLDETDLGTPVDEPDQGATTSPPAAGTAQPADSAAPAGTAPSAGAPLPAASPPGAG